MVLESQDPYRHIRPVNGSGGAVTLPAIGEPPSRYARLGKYIYIYTHILFAVLAESTKRARFVRLISN